MSSKFLITYAPRANASEGGNFDTLDNKPSRWHPPSRRVKYTAISEAANPTSYSLDPFALAKDTDTPTSFTPACIEVVSPLETSSSFSAILFERKCRSPGRLWATVVRPRRDVSTHAKSLIYLTLDSPPHGTLTGSSTFFSYESSHVHNREQRRSCALHLHFLHLFLCVLGLQFHQITFVHVLARASYHARTLVHVHACHSVRILEVPRPRLAGKLMECLCSRLESQNLATHSALFTRNSIILYSGDKRGILKYKVQPRNLESQIVAIR